MGSKDSRHMKNISWHYYIKEYAKILLVVLERKF